MGVCSSGMVVVAAAALWALTACGHPAPDVGSGVISARDPTAAAGTRAGPGPRSYVGGTMIVIPPAADLEPSAALPFSEYDVEDGTDRLAIHIPGPIGCPSIGFTARAEESAERVSVRLIRGLHRGMPPCQAARPEQKREYGVVLVELAHPLDDRTVLSLA
ncbi:hypothetical protein [Nocardia sp. R6R-6]|uniref:hypothetical protein n=1 Tax=Nocardia sp. R6R-6 TaxID=3459303 RepID=UPI00403D9C2A